MNTRAMQPSLVRQSRREAVEIPETRRPERNLDTLLNLRGQRVGRLEQERLSARAGWRAQRMTLRELKLRRRQALQQAKDFWRDARERFFGMVTTSGEYRKARAIYERMKEDAARQYEQCLDAVRACRAARAAFFAACKALREARREHEKLDMLRAEIRLRDRRYEE